MCDCFYLVSTSSAQAERIAAKPAEVLTLYLHFAQSLGKTWIRTDTLLQPLRKHAHLDRRRAARVWLFLFSVHQHRTSNADCRKTCKNQYFGPTICSRPLGKQRFRFGPTLCSNPSGNTPIWTDAELRMCDCFHLVSTSTAQAERIIARTAKSHILDKHFAPVAWENSDSDRNVVPTSQETRPSGPTPSCACVTVPWKDVDSDRHLARPRQETRPPGRTPSCVCATVSIQFSPAPHKQSALLGEFR